MADSTGFEKASPRPWERDGLTIYCLDETGTNNRFSAHIQGGWSFRRGFDHGGTRTTSEESAANAALIVHAVNNIEAREATIAELVEALKKLKAEVSGMRAFEYEIREVVGNTNWGVLMLRAEEAVSALARASKEMGE